MIFSLFPAFCFGVTGKLLLRSGLYKTGTCLLLHACCKYACRKGKGTIFLKNIAYAFQSKWGRNIFSLHPSILKKLLSEDRHSAFSGKVLAKYSMYLSRWQNGKMPLLLFLCSLFDKRFFVEDVSFWNISGKDGWTIAHEGVLSFGLQFTSRDILLLKENVYGQTVGHLIAIRGGKINDLRILDIKDKTGKTICEHYVRHHVLSDPHVLILQVSENSDVILEGMRTKENGESYIDLFTSNILCWEHFLVQKFLTMFLSPSRMTHLHKMLSCAMNYDMQLFDALVESIYATISKFWKDDADEREHNKKLVNIIVNELVDERLMRFSSSRRPIS